jgi:hypothetical protein
MTATLTDLGRRAVACSGWRWMPGMMTAADDVVCAIRVGWIDAGTVHGRSPTHGDRYGEVGNERLLPDLSDAATLGCLLALVREAYGEPRAYTRPDETDGGWWLEGEIIHHGSSSTEAGALVAALEAAP